MTDQSAVAREIAQRLVMGVPFRNELILTDVVNNIAEALDRARQAGRHAGMVEMREAAATCARELRPVGWDVPARGWEIAQAIERLPVSAQPEEG